MPEPAPARTLPLQVAGLSLLLALIVAGVYRGAPDNSFHFDDLSNIVRHGPVRMDDLSVDALLYAYNNPSLANRKLPSLTFAIDWWRGGGEPGAFLQTNVLLHALTAIAMFAFALQVLSRWQGGRSGAVLAIAFIVALFWAVHPINSQAVNLIVQRMAILATLFALLTLSCYLAGRETRGNLRYLWFGAATLFGVLGAISKENAWIAPLLLLGAEYGVVRHDRSLLRFRAEWLLLALPVVAACVVVADLVVQGPLTALFLPGYEIRPFTMIERLLTQPRVVFFYLTLVLLPLPGRFSLEHDIVVSTSLLSPSTTLAAILGICALTAAGIFFLSRARTRILGFLLLWPLATLAIESSFVPLEMIFEHRMYLPLAGIAVLFGVGMLAIVDRYPDHARWLSAVVLLIAAGLAWSTIQRTAVWKDPLTLHTDSVRNAPGSSRAWGNLGLSRYTGGDETGAMAALERALQLSDGQDIKALEHLGVIYLDRGETERAAVLVDRAYELQRDAPTTTILNHKGEVELARGNYHYAVRMFRNAINAAPWNSVYFWNLALAYEGIPDCRAALESWRRYIGMTADADDRRLVEGHIEAEYRDPEGKCFGT